MSSSLPELESELRSIEGQRCEVYFSLKESKTGELTHVGKDFIKLHSNQRTLVIPFGSIVYFTTDIGPARMGM